MSRGAHRVSHVVQTVKETNQVKTFGGITHGAGHLETHTILDLPISRITAGACDRFLMIIETPKARPRKRLCHEDCGMTMTAADIGNFGADAQFFLHPAERR